MGSHGLAQDVEMIVKLGRLFSVQVARMETSFRPVAAQGDALLDRGDGLTELAASKLGLSDQEVRRGFVWCDLGCLAEEFVSPAELPVGEGPGPRLREPVRFGPAGNGDRRPGHIG